MSNASSQQKQRHRARRLAMQALYQWHYNHMPTSELIPAMLEELGATKFDKDYFEILVTGIINEIDAIDAAIEPTLDREITKLNPVEFAILRVSAFEMLHQMDVPYRVVINEGIELAKEFGSDQGHKFVNAVLDKLASKHRALEQ